MTKYGSQQDFSQIPMLGVVPESNSVPPANPVPGQLWTDRSVTPAKVRWHDGTNWIAADGTSIPAGYIANIHVSPTAGIALSKLAVDPTARANHTGTQTASTISDFDAQVRVTRLDQHAAPTNTVDLNGQRIANLANPVSGADAASKSYVDNARAGIAVKDPVRVAANTNINLATPGATIDGVTMVAGDRFLAPSQSTSTQNGIYQYNGASTPATRTTDADGAGEVFDGSMIAVAEGTYGGYQFIQTATASGAPGTWTQTWVVFQTGGQTYTAGTGLSLSGTTFSISAPIPIALGGTSGSSAFAARTNLGAIGKYSANLGAITAGAQYNITHNLQSTDIGAWFRTTTDSREIVVDWAPTGVDTMAVYADMSFAAGAIRCVVVG